MRRNILKLFVGIFVQLFVGLNMISAQTGVVPELKDVAEASKILKTELQKIATQISDIQAGGGTVEESLMDKLELFQAVFNVVDSNVIGTSTFNAIAGNSNLKNRFQDDEAYQAFLNGHWDENMTELIQLMAK